MNDCMTTTVGDRGETSGRSTETERALRTKVFGSNVAPMIGYAPKAISKKAAGELLTVSEKTIERLINRGELPGFRVGWKWRIMLADLEAYVGRQQASNNSKEQFANSRDLKTEIMSAIIAALDAHTAMSTQALNSESVRQGLKSVLLGPAQLYETLRKQAVDEE